MKACEFRSLHVHMALGYCTRTPQTRIGCLCRCACRLTRCMTRLHVSMDRGSIRFMAMSCSRDALCAKALLRSEILYKRQTHSSNPQY